MEAAWPGWLTPARQLYTSEKCYTFMSSKNSPSTGVHLLWVLRIAFSLCSCPPSRYRSNCPTLLSSFLCLPSLQLSLPPFLCCWREEDIWREEDTERKRGREREQNSGLTSLRAIKRWGSSLIMIEKSGTPWGWYTIIYTEHYHKLTVLLQGFGGQHWLLTKPSLHCCYFQLTPPSG